jgi:hypothetical protein
MHHTHASFFQRRQTWLLGFSTLYVLGLILSHAAFPPLHVWVIAAVFSVLMNFTYIIEAKVAGHWLRLEVLIAASLIAASALGVFLHPLFVILAIFGHGMWDLAKHRGAGVPFVSWYTLGCFVIDILYGSVLLLYWVQTG